MKKLFSNFVALKFLKMKSLTNRRSIRKYSNKEVSDELLNSLLKEAERTPTMGNLQLYSVVVTRRDEMKKKLAPAHFNQPMIEALRLFLRSALISEGQAFGQRTARQSRDMTTS